MTSNGQQDSLRQWKTNIPVSDGKNEHDLFPWLLVLPGILEHSICALRGRPNFMFHRSSQIVDVSRFHNENFRLLLYQLTDVHINNNSCDLLQMEERMFQDQDYNLEMTGERAVRRVLDGSLRTEDLCVTILADLWLRWR